MSGCKNVLLTMALPLLLNAGELFHYNFADKKLPAHQLVGNAKIAKGMLSLPDHRSELVVPESNKFNFAKNGTTLMMTCRFIGRSKGTPPLQLLVSKDNSFFLGVYNNKFNFSLSQKGAWPIALIAGTPPADGQWFHLAAVVRPDVEIEQGKNGIQLELFINGNRIRKFIDAAALYPADNTPLRLGINGDWVMGKNSGFIGDIAEIAMIDRALSPREITEALKKSKLVKNLRPGYVEVNAGLVSKLAKMEKSAATNHAKFAAQALNNAAATGADPGVVAGTLEAVAALVKSEIPEDDFVTRWNQVQQNFQLVKTERLISMICTGRGVRVYPVIALYDRAAKRIISAGRFNGWKLESRHQRSRAISIADDDPRVSFTVSPVKYTGGSAAFTITWQMPGNSVVSNCIQTATRFEQDLQVKNHSSRLTLNNVYFPNWRLQQLPGKDTLFYPSFSGRVYSDPIRNGVALDNTTGVVADAMQFRAYYSDDGYGVYVGMEDPVSDYRRSSVLGMYGELEFGWNNPVAHKAANPAGNGYTQSGRTVIEVFTGDWYEAAMIYKKRFLPTANWWIKDLPRTSTPKWFRELPATILVGTRPEYGADVIVYMRRYLGVPVSAHLVGWSAPVGRIWPHFDKANPLGLAFLEKMKKNDVRVIPYSDSVIFSVLDGDDKKSDRDYKRVGLPAAVKRPNGQPHLRRYGKPLAAIVCPGDRVWRDYYTNIVSSIARIGFDGAYHDQQCSCRTYPCFDAKHEFHDVGDPAGWILKGHVPMFAGIRKNAAAINPDFVHTGEDGADPHLKLLDGYTMWRFTEPDHVPAFQAVYAGRIQFSGRTFNHQRPGDWNSSFIKFAEQLAYAEQLGWITIQDLEIATPLRTYFKKLCHLRLAVIKYFNEGEMLKQYKFENMPRISSLWGDANTAHTVTTDQVIHSSWQLSDGRIMALFLNTMEHPNTVKVRHSFGKKGMLAICREGAKTPEYADPSAPPEIKLAPHAAEVWLYSPGDNREEAAQMAAVMHKISTFDMGEDVLPPGDFDRKRAKRIDVAPGAELFVNNISGYTRCQSKYPRSGGGIPQGMLHTHDESELIWKNLHFSAPVNAVEITAAAVGATEVEIFVIDRKGNRKSQGKVQLKSSKKWMEMHRTMLKLPASLQGKKVLLLKFTGDKTRFRNIKFLQ